MSKKKKKLLKANLELLKQKGYVPVQQKNCWFHFKDGSLNLYPTTGKYYDDETNEKGLIIDLPVKTEQTKYYHLDRRYLPDWVLEPKRQLWLKQLLDGLKEKA